LQVDPVARPQTVEIQEKIAREMVTQYQGSRRILKGKQQLKEQVSRLNYGKKCKKGSYDLLIDILKCDSSLNPGKT